VDLRIGHRVFSSLHLSLFLFFSVSVACSQAATTLYVDGSKGDDKNPGTQQQPLKTLSRALVNISDPVRNSVVIELAGGEYSSTGAREMPSNSLQLMRRMTPGVNVTIRGNGDSSAEKPVLAWEGTPMIDAVEGEWCFEDIQIGTGEKGQRRGVVATGPAHVTLKNVVFQTRSLSDAAIYAHRGGKVSLRGVIRINADLHEHADAETFAGIIADDHGLVQFVEREGASLDMGNGSLSAMYYGVIRLGCETARITCWTEQSNPLAINNSGRIDLHSTKTILQAKNPRNTPIGLEHDGHILAEGARIVIEGSNHNAIVLQKASTFTCNEIELRGTFRSTISAMSGSMFVGGFVGNVSRIEASTGASVNIEKIDGKLLGPVTATSCATISLPDRNVISRSQTSSDDDGKPSQAARKAVQTHKKPNDPLFDLQYQFEKMDVLQAWKITRGSPNCLIGVVDLGFDPEHPDYRDNLEHPFHAAGMEHPDTWKAHGTAVIGLIAATADNGIGVAGLAPNCHVVPAALGTHKSFGSPKTADQWNKLIGEKAGEAIRYLVDKGCKVINCSFTTSTTPQSAFEYAIKHDVVVVIGSGNGNAEYLPPPIGSLDVLCVGGADRDDRRWVDAPIKLHGRTITQGSSYGMGLNVVAPMCGLVVCMPRDKEVDAQLKDGEWTEINFGKAMPGYLWGKEGGTSFAAPMASALAGLIRSLRPDLDHKTVIRIIEQGADDLDPPGWDKYTGYGRIDFYRSLRLARDWPRK
jgi:subtilisin family serine protease